MNAFSSLNAHALTSGTRILVTEDVQADKVSMITLARQGMSDLTDMVTNVRITGKRMRIFLKGGGMIYCGVNDSAAVVL